MEKEMKLIIDYKSIIPVYQQIKQYIKLNILNGKYAVDEKITSVRELSKLTKVNQNTVIKAYYQLDQEGFIYSKPGCGYFVKEHKDNQNEERLELFRYATKVYLEKITALGFSVNDIIAEMEKIK